MWFCYLPSKYSCTLTYCIRFQLHLSLFVCVDTLKAFCLTRFSHYSMPPNRLRLTDALALSKVQLFWCWLGLVGPHYTRTVCPGMFPLCQGH